MISSTLPPPCAVFQPHQLGLRSSTVSMPGSRFFSMNGPVPIALRIAYVSSLFLKSCGFSTLCFSAQAFDMMLIWVTWFGRIGSGPLVMKCTV